MNIRNVLILIRVQNKIKIRSLVARAGGGKSKLGFLLIPLLLLAFVPMVAALTGFWVALYFAGSALGLGHLPLVLAFTAGQFTAMVFGIFYVISAFYYAKDLKHLVPLPLRPSEILVAKFVGILQSEYLTLGVMLLPALVVYGLFANVGVTYIPFALLVFLLLPIFPLVLSAVFSLILMRVTNLRRNRDVFRVMGALVGIGTGLGAQYLFRYSAMGGRKFSGAETMQQLVLSQQSLVQNITRWFPTSQWATDALRERAPHGGVPGLLLFSSVAVVAVVLLVWMAERLFFGGLLGGEDTRSSGGVMTGAELARATAQTRSPLRALLSREIKLLNRTPTFLMAGVLPLLIIPLMIGTSLAQQSKNLGDLSPKLQRAIGSPLIPAIAIGVVLFMGMLANLPATAISREGRHFWISRSLPVAPRVQIQAKIIHSLFFTVLNLAIIFGGMAYVHILTVSTFVYVLVGGALVSTASGYVGIMIDLLRPTLTWTDPQQAMKGNLNVLLAMMGSLVLGLLFAAITLVLFKFARPVMMPMLILVAGGMAFGLSHAAGALADKQYVEYEE